MSVDHVIAACSAAIDGGLGDPDRKGWYHAIRGWAYLKQDQPARAVTDLDQAIALGEAGADTYRWRGIAYLQLRQYDRAVADFDQVTWAQPNETPGYVLRGQAYAGSGQYARAVDDFDTAIRFEPDSVEAYRALRRPDLAAADEATIEQLRRDACASYTPEMAAAQGCGGSAARPQPR